MVHKVKTTQTKTQSGMIVLFMFMAHQEDWFSITPWYFFKLLISFANIISCWRVFHLTIKSVHLYFIPTYYWIPIYSGLSSRSLFFLLLIDIKFVDSISYVLFLSKEYWSLTNSFYLHNWICKCNVHLYVVFQFLKMCGYFEWKWTCRFLSQSYNEVVLQSLIFFDIPIF